MILSAEESCHTEQSLSFSIISHMIVLPRLFLLKLLCSSLSLLKSCQRHFLFCHLVYPLFVILEDDFQDHNRNRKQDICEDYL